MKRRENKILKKKSRFKLKNTSWIQAHYCNHSPSHCHLFTGPVKQAPVWSPFLQFPYPIHTSQSDLLKAAIRSSYSSFPRPPMTFHCNQSKMQTLSSCPTRPCMIWPLSHWPSVSRSWQIHSHLRTVAHAVLLLGMLFPQLFTWLLISHHSAFNPNRPCSERPFLTSLSKSIPSSITVYYVALFYFW